MLQKAIYFTILLSFRNFAIAAPTLSSPSLPTVTTANTLQISVPFNNTRTSTLPTSLNDRAPEPLELSTDWPGFVTVTFFNYGAPMFRFAATICAREASRDAFDAHGTAMDDNIDEKQLVYKYINVILTVFPRPAMTWNMFFWMMELVTEFIRDYDPMAFDFEASVLGVVGVAASGNMTALPDV